MKFIITFALLVFGAYYAFAAAPPVPDPLAIPLDPASWLLLGAGGAIAAKKYYDNRNKV